MVLNSVALALLAEWSSNKVLTISEIKKKQHALLVCSVAEVYSNKNGIPELYFTVVTVKLRFDQVKKASMSWPVLPLSCSSSSLFGPSVDSA